MLSDLIRMKEEESELAHMSSPGERAHSDTANKDELEVDAIMKDVENNKKADSAVELERSSPVEAHRDQQTRTPAKTGSQGFHDNSGELTKNHHTGLAPSGGGAGGEKKTSSDHDSLYEQLLATMAAHEEATKSKGGASTGFHHNQAHGDIFKRPEASSGHGQLANGMTEIEPTRKDISPSKTAKTVVPSGPKKAEGHPTDGDQQDGRLQAPPKRSRSELKAELLLHLIQECHELCCNGKRGCMTEGQLKCYYDCTYYDRR